MYRLCGVVPVIVVDQVIAARPRRLLEALRRAHQLHNLVHTFQNNTALLARLRFNLVVRFLAQVVFQGALQTITELEGPNLQYCDEDLVLAHVIALDLRSF